MVGKMTAAIIKVRDLVKRFDDFTAVDHISFAVPEGVVFGRRAGAELRGTHRLACMAQRLASG